MILLALGGAIHHGHEQSALVTVILFANSLAF